MRLWNLGIGRPLSLTLAADARLSHPNYVNDQIWKLVLDGGEPPALALVTTFGLRARSMRLFPRFVRQGQALTQPSAFYRPPVVEKIYPSYLSVRSAPFGGITLLAEYWVPDSQTVAGRLRFRNEGVMNETFRLEWCAVLHPLGEGEAMAPDEEVSAILCGRTTELSPVLFMTGGPSAASSPYPALAVNLELAPGEEHSYLWGFSARTSLRESLEAARSVTARPWDAEMTRIELTNESQQLEIDSGDPDWDAAVALAGRQAFNLFFPASGGLPAPSFVLSREPDEGYSIREDGTDYPYLWNGQTAFDAYYLSSLILPGGLDYCKGIVNNFLSTREEDGSIDWKPGLAGQRAKRLAQPMLAALALRIADASPVDESAWLREVFPGLLGFVKAWFSPRNDRDQDGYPEWAHPLQSGLEETPLFDRWNEGAQGVAADHVEAPGLAAMLYRELRSLAEIAARLGDTDQAGQLEEKARQLRERLNRAWDPQSGLFRYQDRDTHASPPAETLLRIDAPGLYPVDRRWAVPRRLLLRLAAADQATYAVQVTLRGQTAEGEVEESLNARQLYWIDGQGRYTSQHAYTALTSLEVRTMVPIREGELSTVDYSQEDISLFLPLWAGIPTAEQARQMVEETFLKRYLQLLGAPMWRLHAGVNGPDAACAVSLPWNSLVIEGLLRYGYRTAAADLFTRLMNQVVNSLVEDHAFRAAHHAVTGAGLGENNSLHGLPPLGLFLQLAGLKKISPRQVILEGLNPFPRPITVQYRGTTVRLFETYSEVVFASGKTVVVHGPGPHTVIDR